jgi:hypothetical protein
MQVQFLPLRDFVVPLHEVGQLQTHDGSGWMPRPAYMPPHLSRMKAVDRAESPEKLTR